MNNEKNEIFTPVYENGGINKIIPNETKEFSIQTNKTYDKQNMKKDTERNETFNNDLEINNQIQEQEIDINIVDMELNSQLEIVPFKVIEELNRLKIYVEKKYKDTDSLSDSGYKSDSQSRSSFGSHNQIQDTLVNHSAKSLIDFINNSPLVIASKDIVVEISWVLGRLIDKLYIEEKYFLFLEEIISSIDHLLKDIYEGDYDDGILQKDDKINRLFLLNRSNHIIKYTIVKITNILEKYLSQLTNDLLELNNITETENLSYILHILECLLKRYIVNKNHNTQISTQSSQEDRYLKKSNISDIWRRKWNSNYKSITNESLVDTKCMEIKCMEVLNKIIVKSMEGYSLISFSALQCFNLLQT
ncbi:PREDICTED: uncharacterized protein LOC106106009 isoform X1 [Papilio polytes]|uniref:uncharacterized protein LOC106106009 isoform X1 n=1 Tax=Papilio polytes TaxID=76194 RepID=UPI00067672F8|nr:PREDICTED: uncharacterized protein LOC106106009 isoform X1 [Papilio polytes]